MELGLEGKVALVTAASEGLGFGCATKLAEAGCAIAVCARDQLKLERAIERLMKVGVQKIVAIQTDLTKPESIEKLIENVLTEFKRLDILVVNSGHVAYGGLEDLVEQQWYDAFELLLMSVVRLTRLVIPIMRSNHAGDIVVVGSSTVREPPPHLVLSTVMRLGVGGLVKILARSLAKDNIRINLVQPGYFDSGRIRARLRALMKDEEIPYESAAARFTDDIPLGRLGTVSEFGELVAFVASRRAGFMTGSTISIDGAGSKALF